MIVIGDLLGVEPEDHDLLLRWSDDLICGHSAAAAPELLHARERRVRRVRGLPRGASSPTAARDRATI